MSGFLGHGVSVPVVTIEVGAVSLVEILVRVGVVGVVLVSLHLLLSRMLVLGRVILAGVASLAVVALVLLRRDVAVSSDHLTIRMLNVPERILNTVQISHRSSRALLH